VLTGLPAGYWQIILCDDSQPFTEKEKKVENKIKHFKIGSARDIKQHLKVT
jgi:hypothetical protein